METPLTDTKRFYAKYAREDEIIVPAEFSQELERDLRWLLLGTLVLYEDCPLNFAVETCKVFEKWKPEIYKMLEDRYHQYPSVTKQSEGGAA